MTPGSSVQASQKLSMLSESHLHTLETEDTGKRPGHRGLLEHGPTTATKYSPEVCVYPSTPKCLSISHFFKVY